MESAWFTWANSLPGTLPQKPSRFAGNSGEVAGQVPCPKTCVRCRCGCGSCFCFQVPTPLQDDIATCEKLLHHHSEAKRSACNAWTFSPILRSTMILSILCRRISTEEPVGGGSLKSRRGSPRRRLSFRWCRPAAWRSSGPWRRSGRSCRWPSTASRGAAGSLGAPVWESPRGGLRGLVWGLLSGGRYTGEIGEATRP